MADIVYRNEHGQGVLVHHEIQTENPLKIQKWEREVQTDIQEDIESN